MFSLCEGFKWNHLPMAGGLYDQNPDVLDRFYYILAERSKWQASQQKKQEREQNRGAGSSRAAHGGRRR